MWINCSVNRAFSFLFYVPMRSHVLSFECVYVNVQTHILITCQVCHVVAFTEQALCGKLWCGLTFVCRYGYV